LADGYGESLLFVAELNADQDGVGLGQAYIAFTSLPHMTIAAGLFPIPFGVYSERLSPSWVNKFAALAPTPYSDDYGVFAGDQSADGVQVRGDVPLAGKAKATYHLFVVMAPTYGAPDAGDPDARLSFGAADGNHVPPTVGARVGLLPMQGTEIGVSAMTGRIVNTQTIDPAIDTSARRSFAAFDIDAEYHIGEAVLRGEYVRVDYQDPAGLRQHSQGAYLQASHQLTALGGWWQHFEPVVRIGRVQRSAVDNGYQDVSECGVGMNYYFTPFIRSSLVAVYHNVHRLDQISLVTSFAF
jgi:hypothetical protein